MTSRFAINGQQNEIIPQVKFPYLNVLVTGKHTQLILTRGVGLHTIFGMTIDVAVGQVLDRFASEILIRL